MQEHSVIGQEQRIASDNRVHVLFFTSSLGGGGAEMHLLRVINHIDRRRFRLSLALTRSGGAYESALAGDVQLHILNTGTVNSSTLRMARAIKPLRWLLQAEQPDVLCSVLDHANIVAMLAAQGLQQRPRVVLGVQNTPSIKYWHSRHIRSRLNRLLISRLYPQADRVVALSQGVAEELMALMPGLCDSVEVIYNAGLDAEVLNKEREPIPALPCDGPLIVACGRLTEQKGFPYLIRAFAQVRRAIPACLWIIGEGSQRPYLEQQIRELGLADCVRLLGFQRNPFNYMASADVFVLSSLWEGFANVVVEAMACGAPVVATDCPHGPAEIIEHGVSGLLVPPADEAALAEAIERVLTDEELKRSLSHNGRARAQAFHAQVAASAYETLFLHLSRDERYRTLNKRLRPGVVDR